MPNYQILIHPETYQKSIEYLDRLKAGESTGKYFKHKLLDRDLMNISIEQFIELLVRTKRPQIFAESAIWGNGLDWNPIELSLLGDLSIVTPVTVYDNAKHRAPEIHENPFAATLIFTPGALLRNDHNLQPADWEEVTRDGEFDFDRYYRLYERRLLPGFTYIDRIAATHQMRLSITIVRQPNIPIGAKSYRETKFN